MLSKTIKNKLFRVAGGMLRAGPVSWAARRYFQDRAAIVFYHGVWGDDCPRRRLLGGMRVSDFAREVMRLKSFFDVVPLSRIGETFDRPAVAVTFDDGLDMTSSGATDVLDELGIRATMFVNSASLAGGHLMWMHRFSVIRAECGDEVLLRELNRAGNTNVSSVDGLIAATREWPQARKDEWAAQMWDSAGLGPVQRFLDEHRPYFDVEGLKDWMRRGHEVGFHTHAHPFCSQLDDALIAREIIEPAAAFKETIGVEALPFAYPFGDRCRLEHEEKLRNCGLFSALLGTAGYSARPIDPHALERTEGEGGTDREIFGKPLVREYKRRLFRKEHS